MVITDDPNYSSPILEVMNYYPMGLAMKWLNKSVNLSTHNYFRFQGKEIQNMEFGSSELEEYDFSARYYDSQLGIWHNPDPAGQFASPYLAMGDNWTNGIDPSGKTFLGDFFRKSWNTIKIVAGLFAWNNHKTIFGDILEDISRLTWQLPKEAIGLTTAEFLNTYGFVNKVSYFDGTTVLNTSFLANDHGRSDPGSAFTLGSYINGPSDMKVDPSDPTFQHEYGRYLQSQADGPTYLTFTAIPDIFTPGNDNPTAWDGNARALIYFNKYYGGLKSPTNPKGFDWHFDENYIRNGYDPNLSISDPGNQRALKNNFRVPGFWDVFWVSSNGLFGAPIEELIYYGIRKIF
jgi:RHS repeat-associated protein